MTETPKEQSTEQAQVRWRLYEILEAGKTGDLASQIFDYFMVTLIVTNVVAFALDTIPSVAAVYGRQFEVFNIVSVLVFTLEYLTRIWVSAEHKPLAHYGRVGQRLRFIASPYMIIDLLAILPFYLAFLTTIDLRVLRVFRLMRFLKLVRYSPALSSLAGALIAERRALFGALLIMLCMLMVSSSLMYFIEGSAQPEAFGSVPAAMWWGLATLTTVGYGDAVPITDLGRFVGGIVMIMGLGVFALPIGIIATGWSQEIHRRDFVITWGLVARVPLFSKLDATSVAEIVSLLRSRTVKSGEVIVRSGEKAHSMFFISSGRVEARIPSGAVQLTDGDFFGAISLIKGIPSPGAFIAKARTHLLSIDAEDFQGLLARDKTLREHIISVANTRLADGWVDSIDEPMASPEELNVPLKNTPEV